ncbi:MAG: 50S ribosomal protein L11 methyltransferase [Candidatus Omnitrophota bacterium]
MRDSYYEISLKFCSLPGLEELLKQLFCRLGFEEAGLTTMSEKGYSWLKVYMNTRGEADRLVKKIERLNLKRAVVKVNVLHAADWRDKWKDDIRPFRLSEGFDVVPVWNQQGYRPGLRQVIYLNTTMAFGTGLHETTRFMCGLIEKQRGRLGSFLDIGTGTGILSIVAAKCGAKELFAVDIDESSIETAQENLKKNRVAFDWCSAMDFRFFKSRKKFDFVAANVITDELIAMKKKISSVVKPGKYLALSGISIGNLKRLKKEFSEDGSLRCLRVIKGKKWAAALYRKVDAIN